MQAPSQHRSDQAAGFAVYNRLTLAVYDVWVHRLANPLLWGCPTERLQRLYDQHAGASHLDVGVGTGKLLAACDFDKAAHPRIGLLDANAVSLAHAAGRIASMAPATWQRDVRKPISLSTQAFDSIGLTYLLHCLPGPLAHKLTAVDHLLPWLAPGGCLFGATILGDPPPRRRAARALMAIYNRLGIFDNRGDDEAGIRAGLARRFHIVEHERVGSVFLFATRAPKTTP